MKKDKITSLDLLKQINYYRKQEGNRVELQHYDLLKIIRDEFSEEVNERKISPVKNEKDAGNISLMSEEINGGKISAVKNEKDWRKISPMSEEVNGGKIYGVKESYYKDKKGEKRLMYVLTLSQGKQVLVRESKFVRRHTIQYLEQLERTVLQIAINQNDEQWKEVREQEKLVRRKETDTIQELVNYAKSQGSKHPEKLYTVYSRLIHKLLGNYAKEREALLVFDTIDVLRLEQLFDRVIQNGMAQGKHYKDIYQDCQKVGMNYIQVIKLA